jgi:hypothetical protein
VNSPPPKPEVIVNNKISQNTQFAIPPVKMNELLQDLLNLNINKSTGNKGNNKITELRTILQKQACGV